MNEDEKTFWRLLVMGAFIILGKIMSSEDIITLRLFMSRVILGVGTSMMVGVALIWILGLPVIAVVGLGSALGIVGHQMIALWLKRRGIAGLTRKWKADDLFKKTDQ